MNTFHKGITPLLLAILLAAIVVIGGGVAYYYNHKTAQTEGSQNQQTQTQQQQTVNQQTTTTNQTQQQTTTQQNTNTTTTSSSCALTTQIQGGVLSTDECELVMTEGPHGAGPNYFISISNKSGYEELHVSLLKFTTTGGTYSTANQGLSGSFFYQRPSTNYDNLVSGTATVAGISGTNNFNVVFNLNFDGNVTIKGSGVLALKSELLP